MKDENFKWNDFKKWSEKEIINLKTSDKDIKKHFVNSVRKELENYSVTNTSKLCASYQKKWTKYKEQGNNLYKVWLAKKIITHKIKVEKHHEEQKFKIISGHIESIDELNEYHKRSYILHKEMEKESRSKNPNLSKFHKNIAEALKMKIIEAKEKI